MQITKIQSTTAAIVLLISSQCAFGSVLLHDSFDGPTLDTSLWNQATPFSDSFVRQSGGFVEVEDGGRITSVSDLPSTIEVVGRLQISNIERTNSKLLLRTDGLSFLSETKGIAIQFSARKDHEGFGDQLSIFSIGDASNPIVAVTTPLLLDQWYDFRIFDDGLTVQLFWNNEENPILSYTSTYRAGNSISFYSREGAGAGSSISNDGRGRLDFLTVSAPAVPESAASGIFIAATLIGFIAIEKMRKAKT